MNISKIGALWKLMTGGWSGLAVYVLEAFNDLLAKADVDTLKKSAAIVSSVAGAVTGIINVFVSKEEVKVAATSTADALNSLASALADGVMTKDELDANVENVTACISAWKKVG